MSVATPATLPARSSRRWFAGLAAASLGTGLALAPATSGTALPPDADLVGDGVFLESETDRVAPGLDVTRFSRLEDEGWTAGAVLHADLSEPTLSVDVVNSGAVSQAVPVSQMLADSGAVAGVNGDFFDINASNAALGTAVADGTVLNGVAAPRPGLSVADGVAAVGQIGTDAQVTTEDGELDLDGVNTPQLPVDGIGAYTPGWGDHTLDRPVTHDGGTLPEDVARVEVVDDVVTEVREGAGNPDIPADGVVLLGRDAGAIALATLEVGDTVVLDVATDVPADVAITGNEILLADGVNVAQQQEVHPRTVVGVGPDGTELFVLALDGRTATARGMSLPEIADLLLELGAHDAVNLDGGGSTTMLARPAGAADLELQNSPSDGGERPVPNGLAFFSSADTSLADVAVAPASDREHADRVHPGLHRTLTGTGLDANLAPLPAEGEFTVASDAATLASADGGTAVVQGVARGETTVRYAVGDLQAATPLEVLGDVDHVRPDRTTVALESTAETARIHLTAYDADGHGAPVEVSDMEITAPEGLIAEPAGLDAIELGATVEDAAGTVVVEVAGHRVEVAVTAGTEEVEVGDLTDAEAWTYANDRAPGSLAPGDGPEPGDAGLDLAYDFTTSTATRGGYAVPPSPIPLPGQPRAVTVWLEGDGHGTWPRLQVLDGNGVRTNLDGPEIEWQGWQQATFTVPAGTAYPLTLERVRLLETRPDASYQGATGIGPIGVVVAPDVDPVDVPPVHDPVIVTDGTVAERPLQVAVMSDAQFVARDPESDVVAAARRTLAEIVAAEPDLLVINGDLVDEASPEDFALARQILDEEVGDRVPFLYVPGNHEIMGGDIANFVDAFGATNHALTVDRTRILTLNTATGTLRGSGLDQLRDLEAELEAAAEDPGVTGVLVFAHHPTQDPLPSAASQLGDRTEAAALERLLAEFRDETGTSVAIVNAHVGVFHGRSSDGVSHLINGNSGKSPSGTPSTGGFTGWTMLGVNPGAGEVGALPDVPGARLAWMRAEVLPRVDELLLDGPATLDVGESATVSATVVQDEDREVPVAWPMSAQWGGDGVTLDDGVTPALDARVTTAAAGGVATSAVVLEDGAEVLRYNARTGQLTAVQEGSAVLRVTVNGVTTELEVTVGADAPPPGGGDPTDPGEITPPGTDPPTETPGSGSGGGTGDGPGGGTDAGAGGSGALPVTGTDPGLGLVAAIGAITLGATLTAAARARRRGVEQG